MPQNPDNRLVGISGYVNLSECQLRNSELAFLLHVDRV
ncbi:hypothetical protein PORCRE_794 [Porphyromonas crevioricanis JCM 15906]|uniref:Uncharacterized protein n=1 Tax=Porphyromonas crevioricanis JCM 15906 TaxID=1305617 RepID=T1CH14_9PORP|nr:hypothetical protein PORCRE_794 [Porphyromonas crevioricanis JCM 15906]GAD07334.1 hypothetical protein PORCAN_954 [Porphyromonas crevioricanis JCM 13913]